MGYGSLKFEISRECTNYYVYKPITKEDFENIIFKSKNWYNFMVR